MKPQSAVPASTRLLGRIWPFCSLFASTPPHLPYQQSLGYMPRATPHRNHPEDSDSTPWGVCLHVRSYGQG